MYRLSKILVCVVTALCLTLLVFGSVAQSARTIYADCTPTGPKTFENCLTVTPIDLLTWPTPTPEKGITTRQAQVTTTLGLRVRADHSTTAPIKNTLAWGAVLTIIGEPIKSNNCDWYAVEGGFIAESCNGFALIRLID